MMSGGDRAGSVCDRALDGRVWAAPAAWICLVAVLVRLGRLEPAVALAGIAVVALVTAGARVAAASGGGVAGRVADLVLVGSAVGALLAEPSAHRVVVVLAGAIGSAALVVVGVWSRAGRRPVIATLVGLAAGAALTPGLSGSELWGVKALMVVAASGLTTAWLTRLLPAELAMLTAVAGAAVIGPGHAAAFLLPLMAAFGLVALSEDRTERAALAAAAAAALPPAGLCLTAALAIAAWTRSRSLARLWPLVAAVPLAWWRWPTDVALLGRPVWSELAAALPLAPAALPLLAPVVVLGLVLPRALYDPAQAGMRTALAVGGLALVGLGRGDWLGAAIVALWLLALPAAARHPRFRDLWDASLPWSAGAGLVLLLAAPWGGATALIGCVPARIGLGWVLAMTITLTLTRTRERSCSQNGAFQNGVLPAIRSTLARRAARLAWMLPIAGLLWTLPVEGGDRRLDPGQTLGLVAVEGGWAVQVERLSSEIARLEHAWSGRDLISADRHGPALTLVETGGTPSGPGRVDAPGALESSALLSYPSGIGRDAAVARRSVHLIGVRSTGNRSIAETLLASEPVLIRVERGADWRHRRWRLAWLGCGVGVLLLAAALARWVPRPCFDTAAALGLGWLVAAGSATAPLARAAVRDAPDLALAVLVTIWLGLLPPLLRRRRRLLAAVCLLVPLALAQPLLRWPAGDEVYHLELLESLSHDHDLDLVNNLDLDNPREAIYAPHGSQLIHSPALAVLTLPGYLALGHAGALVTIALMVSVAGALVARRAEELGYGRRAVHLGWLLTVATYPVLTFATQLWPAAVGMLAVATLLVATSRPRSGLGRLPAGPVLATAAATALALAVKVRLGLVALPLALVPVLEGPFRWAHARLSGRSPANPEAGSPRRLPAPAAAALVLVVLAGIIGGGAVLTTALGNPLGRHRLGELIPSGPMHALIALWGLAWDPGGGLAFAAPLWLVAALGVAGAWRRGSASERALITGAGLTVLALLPRGEWYGGGSPPARYLVPLMPLAMLALIELASTARGRRWIGLAGPWAAIAAWVAATRPLQLFNPVDGGWWLGDRLARALDADALSCFPTLLRPQTAAIVVPLVILTGAICWTRRRLTGAAGLTLAGLIAVVAAIAALPAQQVHAEDPQVRHLAGVADPPPGTFFRVRDGISWRLRPGDALEIPWRPPEGRRLVARARVDAPFGAAGVLASSWDGGPARSVLVMPRRWRAVELAAPVAKAGILRLEWQATADRPEGDLLVDLVTAAPPVPKPDIAPGGVS